LTTADLVAVAKSVSLHQNWTMPQWPIGQPVVRVYYNITTVSRLRTAKKILTDSSEVILMMEEALFSPFIC
jgi:hypothetical protein